MWKDLFHKALRALEAARIPRSEWTLGGGTALAFYFQHRESKDVDIFLRDAQYLTFLTPRLNNAVLDLTDDYTEGSHFLKLKFYNGEINFIIAPYLTGDYYEMKLVAGKRVRVEKPEEIAVKKLFYRAETLKARDVIDVAVVYERRETYLLECTFLIAPRLGAIKRRWKKIKGIYAKEASRLSIFDSGLAAGAPLLFEAFLREASKCDRSNGAGG